MLSSVEFFKDEALQGASRAIKQVGHFVIYLCLITILD